MENEEMVEQETLDTAEDQSTLETDTTEEDVETLKERLLKAEELAKNQRIRAEKAERLAKKKPVEQEEEKKSDNLSLSDIRALNDVHDEDVDEVRDYAVRKGISIAEAKKSPYLKAYLAQRAEERKTAEAASVQKTRRSSGSSHADVVLKKLNSQEDMSGDEFKSAASTLVAQMKGQK